MNTTEQKGFTLIEVLVAATIIALLAAVAVVSYGSVNQRSRDAKRKADLEQVRSALEMYRADNRGYPPTGAGVYVSLTSVTELVTEGYLPSVPSDPKPAQRYSYKAMDWILADGKWYGYCLSAVLESEDPADACTPDASQVPAHNYGLSDP